MNRERYIQHSLDYFKGKITIKKLMEMLNAEISFSVSGKKLLPSERFLIIANHSLQTPELYIPAKKIENLKGGNKYNYETFHFPILTQILFQKLIGNKFTAIVEDIGWIDVSKELGHVIVKKEGDDKLKDIVSKLTKSNKSIVVFPEGGSRRLAQFHSGFLHIAQQLNIKYLVVAATSPRPSLKGHNFLKVIKIFNLDDIQNNFKEFVEEQRM